MRVRAAGMASTEGAGPRPFERAEDPMLVVGGRTMAEVDVTGANDGGARVVVGERGVGDTRKLQTGEKEDHILVVGRRAMAEGGAMGANNGGAWGGVGEREVGDDRKLQSGKKGRGAISDCGSSIGQVPVAGSGGIADDGGSGHLGGEEEGVWLPTVHSDEPIYSGISITSSHRL